MHSDSVVTELRAVAREFAAAIVSNDTDVIGSFLADEWVIVGSDGGMSRNRLLTDIASGDLTHDAMDLVDDPRVLVYGDTAVVTARITNSGVYLGHPFTADEWTTDVFVRRDNRWVCVHSHVSAASASTSSV
jgi:ketosteroid isomerase-like protein